MSFPAKCKYVHTCIACGGIKFGDIRRPSDSHGGPGVAIY